MYSGEAGEHLVGIKQGQEAAQTLDYASAPAGMNNLVDEIRHYNATD